MSKGNMSLDFILCRHNVSFLANSFTYSIQPVFYGTQSKNTTVTEIHNIKNLPSWRVIL